MALTGKDLIAYRTARFFNDGDIVNLGIGMPTKCLDYLPEDIDIWIDSENGVVGLTGAPGPDEEVNPYIVDAGGRPSKMRVGAVCFDSFRSFGFIRGGHIGKGIVQSGGLHGVDGCLAAFIGVGQNGYTVPVAQCSLTTVELETVDL